jgi:hypothetical protein
MIKETEKRSWNLGFATLQNYYISMTGAAMSSTTEKTMMVVVPGTKS